MPAKSKSQQRLMAAALHGATFKKAAEVRESMTTQQLREFATTGPLAKLTGGALSKSGAKNRR